MNQYLNVLYMIVQHEIISFLHHKNKSEPLKIIGHSANFQVVGQSQVPKATYWTSENMFRKSTEFSGSLFSVVKGRLYYIVLRYQRYSAQSIVSYLSYFIFCFIFYFIFFTFWCVMVFSCAPLVFWVSVLPPKLKVEEVWY